MVKVFHSTIIFFISTITVFVLVGFYNSWTWAMANTPHSSMSTGISPVLSPVPQETTCHHSSLDCHVEFSPDSCSSYSTKEFDSIYQRGRWFEKIHQPEYFYGEAQYPPQFRRSASGPGSYHGGWTNHSLIALKATITKYNVSTMIDVPCGDVNWIFESFLTDSLPLYLGLDISSLVTEVNRKRFAHHRNKYFMQWDASSCKLPQFRLVSNQVKPKGQSSSRGSRQNFKSFDLIHVRDVIQHMPLEHGMKYMCNVFRSGARVFVATTFLDGENKNIPFGEWYHNNFFAPPFDFDVKERDEACKHKSHADGMENDHTCSFDLRKPWVKEWVEKNCRVGS